MNISFTNPPITSSPEELEARARQAIQLFNDSMRQAKMKNDSRWQVWIDMHGDMAEALTVENLLQFQNHPSIAPQITGGSGKHYLTRIGEVFGLKQLHFLLRNHTETVCGNPADFATEDGTYITVTSMRHLYHLAKISFYHGNLFRRQTPFLEIGGGFGNLARMISGNGLASQYYIIDHPVLHAIQYFFLTQFFTPEDIAIHGPDGNFLNGTEASLIQLVPLFHFEHLTKKLTRPYTLVSTMALTEIPRAGQDKYLETLSPALVYVFGQLQNFCVGGGRSSGDCFFSNEALVYRLGEHFHTLDYDFWGYHFEYIGRQRTARQ